MHPLETLMNEEIIKVKNSKNFVVKYNISCKISTPKAVFGSIAVSDFSLLRDYINKFSDVISITAAFAKGTIIHDILPFAKELEVLVILKPLANVPEYIVLDSIPVMEYKFKGILYDNPQEIIKANQGNSNSKEQSNIEDIGYLQLQLVNPVQEALRTATFGCVIRDVNPMDAIRAILTKFSKIEGIEKTHEVKGVDVQDGYDKKKRDHIVVPHLSPVIRIPRIIEEVCGGIYPTGFQYYLQQSYWYIWSPYDTTRYGKDAVSMTVFNIPENKLSQIEKSFRKTNNQLIILSTGKVEFFPIAEKNIPNKPPAVRFVDSRRVLDKFGRVEDNKLIVEAKKNINELQEEENQEYNPKNLAVESEVRITDKYMLEYSEFAKKKGAMLQFTWENSVDGMIYPGMPVRFVYMSEKEPKQVYGTVIAIESAYISNSVGMMQRRFVNTTRVSLFVTDKIEDKKMQ